jgi:hypothetical protein
LGQIMLLNVLTPIFRVIDRLLPVPSLSLVAVLAPRAAKQAPAPPRQDLAPTAALT